MLCQTNLNALGELEMCYDVYIWRQSPFFSVTQSYNSQKSWPLHSSSQIEAKKLRHPRRSDACNLRLLGLRATIEVLKQLPVIAKRNELAKATEHFIPRTRMFAEPPPSPPLRFCSRFRRSRTAPTREEYRHPCSRTVEPQGRASHDIGKLGRSSRGAR